MSTTTGSRTLPRQRLHPTLAEGSTRYARTRRSALAVGRGRRRPRRRPTGAARHPVEHRAETERRRREVRSHTGEGPARLLPTRPPSMTLTTSITNRRSGRGSSIWVSPVSNHDLAVHSPDIETDDNQIADTDSALCACPRRGRSGSVIRRAHRTPSGQSRRSGRLHPRQMVRRMSGVGADLPHPGYQPG